MVTFRNAVLRLSASFSKTMRAFSQLGACIVLFGVTAVAGAQDHGIPQIYDVTIVERAIERVVFAIAGATCVYFGYKLFYVVTTQASEAKFQGRSYSLVLKDVGPGVLFCLFGCLLMGLSIVNGPKIDGSILASSATATSDPAGWSGAVAGAKVDDTPHELWAIGAVRQRLTQPESASAGTVVDPAQVDKLLYQVQLRLLRGKYSEDEIASYELLAQMRKSDQKGFNKIVNASAPRKASFEEIDQAIDGESP